jgi:hypothetical protein
MQRRAATALHLALSVVGAVLYVLFVLPRWWVLTGDFPDTLATVGRVAAGVPIALAAVPVLNLRQSIKPEMDTSELALRLRAWSAVLHVVAGVLIILTAIAEIWISIDAAGPWLFAVYGAAAEIAVLGVLAFYLSFIAEQPPRAPKPAKPVKQRKARGKSRGAEADTVVQDAESVATAAEDDITDEVSPEPTAAEAETSDVTTDESAAPAEDSAPVAGLLNKRPTGKARKGLRR